MRETGGAGAEFCVQAVAAAREAMGPSVKLAGRRVVAAHGEAYRADEAPLDVGRTSPRGKSKVNRSQVSNDSRPGSTEALHVVSAVLGWTCAG